jgi:Esterase-like activity of phytase
VKRVGWMRAIGLLPALLAGAGALSCASPPDPLAATGADTLYVAGGARFEFEAPQSADPRLLPQELSGVTWVGGDEYLAIGDAHACVYRMTVRVDPTSARVLSATFGRPMLLRDQDDAFIADATQGEDREGIAPGLDSSTVWISNERTGRDNRYSSIAEHRLPDGLMTRLVETGPQSPLAIYSSQRPNRGLESLALSPDRSGYWTANEATLRIDGAEANDTIGGVVRLQRLSPSMAPVAQYAYPVDRYPAHISSPFFLAGIEVSGVSELAALPDGRLLVLERSFAGDSSGAADFRNRLYLADTSEATDVSKGALAEGLVGRKYTPVRKKLLWEIHGGLSNSNFEGMALGPPLDGADRVLLLVADNNGGGSEALYSLRLHVPRGDTPEPATKP